MVHCRPILWSTTCGAVVRARLSDIKSAGEDVSGDEDLGGAVAELVDNFVSQLIVHVPPDARAPVTLTLHLHINRFQPQFQANNIEQRSAQLLGVLCRHLRVILTGIWHQSVMLDWSHVLICPQITRCLDTLHLTTSTDLCAPTSLGYRVQYLPMHDNNQDTIMSKHRNYLVWWPELAVHAGVKSRRRRVETYGCMEAARNLPSAHEDDGLAQLLALREDHLLQHTHLVQRGGAVLDIIIS